VANYESFQKQIFELTKTGGTSAYNTDDYNNPMNYDLYYQSLYQMYPQMSDYYKKAADKNRNPEQQPSNHAPYVIFNTGILDPNQQENNSLYDPNVISGYYNNQGQMQNTEGREDISYLTNFHTFYDYENNRFVQQPIQQPQEEKKKEDEIYDPFGIKTEPKEEEKKLPAEENKGGKASKFTDNNEKNMEKESINYSDIDYEKYISNNFSNFQPGKKGKGRGGKNMPPQKSSSSLYNKEEINRSVNMYYENFADELEVKEDIKEEAKFQEPFSQNKKRKSRFEENPSNS